MKGYGTPEPDYNSSYGGGGGFGSSGGGYGSGGGGGGGSDGYYRNSYDNGGYYHGQQSGQNEGFGSGGGGGECCAGTERVVQLLAIISHMYKHSEEIMKQIFFIQFTNFNPFKNLKCFKLTCAKKINRVVACRSHKVFVSILNQKSIKLE